jgi:hypothetical protein
MIVHSHDEPFRKRREQMIDTEGELATLVRLARVEASRQDCPTAQAVVPHRAQDAFIATPRPSLVAIGAMHVGVALPARAQRVLDTLPASAYARAERFMQHRAADKMYGNRVDVRWLADGSRFWYSVETPEGTERYLVDLVRNTRQLLIDRRLLA